MISNVLLGTNNIEKSEIFYDEILAFFGAKQVMKNDNAILWKSNDCSVGIAICTPHDKLSASNGNGVMVGLKAETIEMVIRVYEAAIRLGGTCAGKPGERKAGVFAAYFRDLDQNKFGLFYIEDNI